MIPLIRPIRKVYQFFVDHPIESGVKIANRYKIRRILGRGSFGIAYECSDLETNKRFAVKQLRPSKRKNKKDLHMFLNEAAILGNLEHRAIPKFHESFSFEGNLFYSMDFIEGENLEDVLFENRRQFNEKESLLLLQKLIKIVDYLHQEGIYHGDLRIPNVILQDGQPFLIDFGLAQSLNSETNTGLAEQTRLKKGEIGDKLTPNQNDYYDLGDLLLFLLYSTYPTKNKKALPWTEELSLHSLTTNMIQRLLGIGELYTNSNQLLNDIDAIVEQMKIQDQSVGS